MSRDSSGGMVNSHGLGDRETAVRVPVRSRIFSFPRRSDRLWGSTCPPVQWVQEAFSPGCKEAGA
jgi:hypothetical protein